MQKVEGSSPFSRFQEPPAATAFPCLPARSTDRAGRHFCWPVANWSSAGGAQSAVPPASASSAYPAWAIAPLIVGPTPRGQGCVTACGGGADPSGARPPPHWQARHLPAPARGRDADSAASCCSRRVSVLAARATRSLSPRSFIPVSFDRVTSVEDRPRGGLPGLEPTPGTSRASWCRASGRRQPGPLPRGGELAQ